MLNSYYSFAEDVINGYSGSAHLKDIQSGKYVISNISNLDIFGFSAQDQIIGYSIWDLNSFMSPYWGNNFANEINDIDIKTSFTNINHNIKKWFLSPDKKLRLHEIQKIPIKNSKGKITSILTLSNNNISNCNYFELYRNYKFFYKNKNTAIKEFLSHIEAIDYFYCLPTESELEILILKYKYNFPVKEISSILKKSVKSIEQHIYNLRSIKLLNFDLYNVLNKFDTSRHIYNYISHEYK
ncbi:MAG: hypothetical protein K2P99_03750 [Burkholderiales bacterium]|nr:hypothetical protein [Burkholderiales bacterium]